MTDNENEETKRLIAKVKKALSDVEDALQQKSEDAAKKIAQERLTVRLTLIFRGLELEGQIHEIDEATISWVEDIVPMEFAELVRNGLARRDRLTGYIDCKDVDLIVNAKDLSIETSIKESKEL